MPGTGDSETKEAAPPFGEELECSMVAVVTGHWTDRWRSFLSGGLRRVWEGFLEVTPKEMKTLKVRASGRDKEKKRNKQKPS